MSPDQFIGLPKRDAQNLVERFNFIFRLIRVGQIPMIKVVGLKE